MSRTDRWQHVAGFELETGAVIDARPMTLIVDYNLLTILYITSEFSNTDTFFRSALYSATIYYELGWLHQLLTSVGGGSLGSS